MIDQKSKMSNGTGTFILNEEKKRNDIKQFNFKNNKFGRLVIINKWIIVYIIW